MSTDTASLFAQNRDEVMTPILPANVNGPGLAGPEANKNGVLGIVASAALSNKDEGQRVANDAMAVGQTLQDPGEGIQAKQSDAAYLTKQVGQSLSQVSTGLLSVFGDEHKGNQAESRMGADDLDNRAKFAAPPPQMHATASPGFGGGPG